MQIVLEENVFLAAGETYVAEVNFAAMETEKKIVASRAQTLLPQFSHRRNDDKKHVVLLETQIFSPRS